MEEEKDGENNAGKEINYWNPVFLFPWERLPYLKLQAVPSNLFPDQLYFKTLLIVSTTY